MPNYKEMAAVASDPVRFRALAKSLLGAKDLTGWELEFLERIVAKEGIETLSMRQREKLFELRDGNQYVTTTYDGLSIPDSSRRMLASPSRSRLDRGP